MENESSKDSVKASLPFNLKDYIELVDWTGRAIRDDKRGFISPTEPKLLDKLGLNEKDWLLLTTKIQRQSILMFSGLERIQCYTVSNRCSSG